MGGLWLRENERHLWKGGSIAYFLCSVIVINGEHRSPRTDINLVGVEPFWVMFKVQDPFQLEFFGSLGSNW